MSTGAASQTGSDFAVVGLVHAFVLFLLIIAFGQVSGGHFNPVVTLAAATMKRIDPVDAVVYILAQLSGAVLGALLVKAILLDEGRATDYGAATISPLIAGPFAASVVEGLGDLPARARRSARSRSTRAPARSGRRSRSGPRSASR